MVAQCYQCVALCGIFHQVTQHRPISVIQSHDLSAKYLGTETPAPFIHHSPRSRPKSPRFTMEDSPLSIAASITGILTFVAAVLASIYIRYNTLQNGQVELEKVLKSVKISLEETSKVSTQAASSGDPASTQVHQIINDLYELELAIVGHCMSAFGYDKPLQPGFHQVIDSTLTQQHRDLLSLIPDSPTSLLEAIGIILRLGTTRTLMRWYMIREDVLEKMQTRDHLRSRLLMAQISTLSS